MSFEKTPIKLKVLLSKPVSNRHGNRTQDNHLFIFLFNMMACVIFGKDVSGMSVLSYAIACPFMPNASWDAKPDILTLQYGIGDLFITDNG